MLAPILQVPDVLSGLGPDRSVGAGVDAGGGGVGGADGGARRATPRNG